MATKKINTKAQIIGQVLMFVLAAIVFSLIMLYGYNAITSFLEKSETVALANFQNDFVNGVEAIKRDYGSISKLELTLPTKYTVFCIADSDTTTTASGFEQKYPRMHTAWHSGSENVFLLPSTKPIKIDDITVPTGYFCSNTFGKITLKLEGLGDKARVSSWPAA